MITLWDWFRTIWAVDFEYDVSPGSWPSPHCLVARELRSDLLLHLWRDQMGPKPPYDIGPNSLVIAYYASAEWGCHLALGWPLPYHVVDLYAEFRCLTNGLRLPCGRGLLGALAFYGLEGMGTLEKEEMRLLAMRGGPYSPDEQRALLDYCQTDVDALGQLLPRMQAHISLPHALLRGRYTRAAAKIEHVGTPIDVEALTILREQWHAIQCRLIQRVDQPFGVYEDLSFRYDKFKAYLARHQIPWQYSDAGRLDLRDETFKAMANLYPQLRPLHELRVALSKMRLEQLAVGPDGRNRTLLSMFQSTTGRNQPSNTQFIFGPSVWIRCLIRPQPGYGVAYCDWAQQEFAIAAVLSEDPAMQEAYLSGDPYLRFGIQAGQIPPEATKASHKAQRELFKRCALGVQYSMGERSLALDINRPLSQAQELLNHHRRTYAKFWHWSDRTVDFAMLHRKLWTRFGWTLCVTASTNPRSLRNFLMQANGSEMLRLACCYATEEGIQVCAPVHDAVLVEAPLEQLAEVVRRTQRCMAEASRQVLNGFELRTDAEIVQYPDRYVDERGQAFWNAIWSELDQPAFAIG